MTDKEIEILMFRRQYLISPQVIICPFVHSKHLINKNYILYTHIDLSKCHISKYGIEVILLGDIFSYEDKNKGHKEILQDVLDKDYSVFIKNTYKYTGRFVLIYINGEEINILHDLSASRKVYYNFSDNKYWLSSNPKLLAEVLGFQITQDKSKLDFYHSDIHILLNNANIGNTTCYDEIFQLMPNKYLSIDRRSIIRYWPDEEIKVRSVDDAAKSGAMMIKGYIESIASRYKSVMMPITAGNDSRTLLAASKDCSENITYYTNVEKRMQTNFHDITIPKKLLKDLRLDYMLVNIPDDIDQDFKKVYYKMNDFPSEFYLPHIYNYYKKYSDKVNLPGGFVGTGVYLTFNLINKHLTPKLLTKFVGVTEYPYACDYYSKWLDECLPLADIYNINLGTLFYLEERVANWGTQLQTFKDIAQEEVMPFNSREFLMRFFEVEEKFNAMPDFLLSQKIIQLLWPETLSEPINPSIKNKILALLKSVGLLYAIRKVKASLEIVFQG